MKMQLIKNKGFTLIELLVVVAIIGLLSSVVLASLNSARNKAKDAAIKEAASQLATVMELNYTDYGSYCQIQPQATWISYSYSCDTLFSNTADPKFSGTYAQKALDLCNNMYNNAAVYSNGNIRMMIYLPSSPCTKSFSWQIFLNNGNWYCVGSSAKGETTNRDNGPGCNNNP